MKITEAEMWGETIIWKHKINLIQSISIDKRTVRQAGEKNNLKNRPKVPLQWVIKRDYLTSGVGTPD